MSSKKTTIYDLAALAQTSAATVSAVLNGTWRKRRITEKTAERIQQIAKSQKYSVNRQASGLRRSRSGLIGMIIPMHDNRFFSSMSQAFERLARERHLVPMVVSTLRDPKLEVETVRTLISYQVEHLVITGATDPDAVSRVCHHHGVKHVNVDLPGHMTASVISDNYWGAKQLTKALIERSQPQQPKQRDLLYFIGGIAADYATQRRIEGFSDAISSSFGRMTAAQVDACGYAADLAEAATRELCARIGGLPRGLLVNSTIALEGAVRFLSTLSADELNRCSIGSYDWDPFAEHLSFPVLMVRQNVRELLSEAFRIIDSGKFIADKVVEIRPELIVPPR